MNQELKMQLIESSIQDLSREQLQHLQELVEALLTGATASQAYKQLISLVAESSLDVSYATVVLAACGLSRSLVVPDRQAQETEEYRDLVWIKDAISSAHSRKSLGHVQNDDGILAGREFEGAAIVSLYQACLGRTPVQKEIDIWKANLRKNLTFPEFVTQIVDSNEAAAFRRKAHVVAELSDGRFIQHAYEALYGRGCSARELSTWEKQPHTRPRRDVLARLFTDFVSAQKADSSQSTNNPLTCRIMGTKRVVGIDDWKKKSIELERSKLVSPDERYTHRFRIKSEPKFLVTAIASLYKGKEFIEQFMDNIVSQSCFRDYCELIVVDANSPDNEQETIKRYLSEFKGIRYFRANYRVGIYDAWNIGIELSRGEYLTNTNVDDLRRHDSLELQAGVLDHLPFVDVVYQDFYYSFEPRLTFDKAAAFGYQSNLPVVNPHNMMEFNSPHNAPMWRKRLHRELGNFDTTFRSAGDYEFWMRCLAAGKVFYKLNDPHVVYYQNPEGISTRANTRGMGEAARITRMYARKLISDNCVISWDEYCRARLGIDPEKTPTKDRYAAAQLALRESARRLKYRAADS